MTGCADASVDAEELGALDMMLPHVPLYGWTSRALAEGLRDAGRDVSEAASHFPGGAPEMIELFFAASLSRAVAAAALQVASEMRLTKRVRALVAGLLGELGSHKDALRRAIAWLALPVHAKRSALILSRLVNGIWDAAGDPAAETGRHTKRASLAAALLPTLLFFLSDMEADHEATLAFFDRRLRGLGRIGRLRAKMRGACAGVIGRRARAPGKAAA